MEPMTLGSPAGSPPSSGVSYPYLQPYLLGDTGTSPISKGKPSSPIKSPKHVSFGNTSYETTVPKTYAGAPEVDRSALRSTLSMEKSNGPPIKCLFDTLDESFASPKSVRSSERSYFDINNSVMSGHSQDKSLPSVNDTWVTVFGFPPSATTFIASQFSNCGLIVDKRVPPKGNWMHLRFQTPHEAHKALNYNGKVFSGSIMLGVTPCQEQDILHDSYPKENIMDGTMSGRNMSNVTSPGLQQTVFSPNTSSNRSFLGTPVRMGNARPLAQSFRPGQSENEVLNQSNTPQKSTSMVTKAMEYVFGW